MRIEIVPGGQLGGRAAALVAATLRAAVAERGRATAAFSGGSTAGMLLSALTEADVPWAAVDVLQVDERVAPARAPDRNLTTLRGRLLDHVPLPADRLHPMPVDGVDLGAGVDRYIDRLHELAGRPPVLDVVHLGLGPDGHTASLVPGSPVLDACQEPVAATGPYQGRRRMTLTLPTLSRARLVLWLVSGAAKASVVRQLVDGDATIPAARVDPARAVVLVDPPASTALPAKTIETEP